ncbi:Uu.00g140790.m01.CDS01 [Anthostomella pinea]|uniref:Uu.00g140790.m01.CDS01 n=1 Tax=Anthostomella pinea TaxID=933095 RepID=A0AAI8VQ58_9PEZI|nr:Uu.00g140790.m01.CDS01 [Anthostomella pinea]
MSQQDHSLGSNNPFRRKASKPPPAGSPGPADRGAEAPNPSSNSDSYFDCPSDNAPRPPFATFKSALPENQRRDEEEAPVQPRPKKIVKKVRVQSPPPSSPEDATPVNRFPPRYDDDDSASSDGDSSNRAEQLDPFNTKLSDSEDMNGSDPPLPRIPPNPFARTLQDLEQPGQSQDANALAGGLTKGSLDVDSFKRLLLTGLASIPGPTSATGSGGNLAVASHLQAPLHDGASNTNASSISRQSILDAMQETPRTSHEVSEPDESEAQKTMRPASPLGTVPSASTRKKPPPPSSRHGKLIKMEFGADSESRGARGTTPPTSLDTSLPNVAPLRKSSNHSITPLHSPPSITDVNKPLPLPPFRPSTDGEIDSPFDREAAGKLPEAFDNLQEHPKPPAPPLRTRNRSESQTSTHSQKPAAPPPRRHGRSSSRAPSINTADEEPPRSSMESNLSRAGSLRVNISSERGPNPPAPPPPRRPQHGRQSSLMSPTHGSLSPALASPVANENERSPLGLGYAPAGGGAQAASSGSLATVTTSKDGVHQISPPPPPPARHTSTRRPPSVRSMESGSNLGTARRVSKEKDEASAPPPPPPPRVRGGSRNNADASAPSATSSRNTSAEVKPVEEEPAASTPFDSSNNQGTEILTDLDALQREIDALMGKYPNASAS